MNGRKLIVKEDIDKYNKPNSCVKLEKIYCSDSECDAVYEIRDKNIDHLIGKGASGEVYQACLKEDCRYVGKWIENNNRSDIITELTIQNELSVLGIAPLVKQALICSNGGMIIMDGLKMTLFDYLSGLSEHQKEALKYDPPIIIDDDGIVRESRLKLIEDIVNLVKYMNDQGYIHNDLHLNNIMIDQYNRPYIIDFGQAEKYNIITDHSRYSDLDKVRYKLRMMVQKHPNLEYLLKRFDLEFRNAKLSVPK